MKHEVFLLIQRRKTIFSVDYHLHHYHSRFQNWWFQLPFKALELSVAQDKWLRGNSPDWQAKDLRFKSSDKQPSPQVQWLRKKDDDATNLNYIIYLTKVRRKKVNSRGPGDLQTQLLIYNEPIIYCLCPVRASHWTDLFFFFFYVRIGRPFATHLVISHGARLCRGTLVGNHCPNQNPNYSPNHLS